MLDHVSRGGDVPVVTIQQLATLDDDLADAAWTLYRDCFEDLNAYAAQRHLMTSAEFKEVMADPRLTKFVTRDDAGRLAGLATFTNDLDAVPLIAPPYFARRWPTHYQQRRIWYIGFVAVAPHARRTRAFVEVFTEFYRIAQAADGLVALDICQFNEDLRHLPRAISLQLAHLSDGRSRAQRADTQSFWVFDMRGDTLRDAA